MAALRIGINALFLIPGAVGGSEVYLRELVSTLSTLATPHRFLVYLNRETLPSLVPEGGRCEPRVLPVQARHRPARILFEQLHLPRICRADRIDVLLNAGFTAPLVPPCPQATVVYDLQHKRHPEYFRWFDLPAWQFLVWAAVHRSARVLTLSEASRDDLLRYYTLPPSKIAITRLAAGQEFFDLAACTRNEPRPPFFLCASTTHPHKNHTLLLSAFARFRKQHPEWRLVMTGVRGFAAAEVTVRIRELGLQGAVELPGWVPKADLLGLYRDARAMIYPSRFEGFGLPVVEAMAAGLPVVCSDIEPLRSNTAAAALRFNPSSEDALFQAMHTVAFDEAERARLIAAGKGRAAEFSWRRTAEKTVEVLEEIAQRK